MTDPPASLLRFTARIDRITDAFGAVVAVTLQTAFLSPPVAMSAYYLKQVVAEWPLATIYKGMFEFMGIQVVAIALLVSFPAIATWLPNYLFSSGALVVEEPTVAPATSDPWAGYGDSYEAQYQRSLKRSQQRAPKAAEPAPAQ
jgi:hypothetical protein